MISAIATAPARFSRTPVRALRSTERMAVKTTFSSWQYISAKDVAARHVHHDNLLDGMVSYHQNAEYRVHFSHFAKRPEIVEEAAFMKWIEEMETAECDEARMRFEAEAEEARKNLDENSRLWFPFRNRRDFEADD